MRLFRQHDMVTMPVTSTEGGLHAILEPELNFKINYNEIAKKGNN